MALRTIAWTGTGIRIIDQTALPEKLVYRSINDIKALWRAIKELQVRGAPALGAAAGLGAYLGIRNSRAKNFAAFLKELHAVARYLGSSRPTARNLFWGLERMSHVAQLNKTKSVAAVKKALLGEALRIIEEDRRACRLIGTFGASLVKNGDRILTICNAGILATIDYGTALGVLYRAKQDGKKFSVFSCETRPLLQGARLTTWELQKRGIDVTLIGDSMAAMLMRQGKIDTVITGADRITARGDAANKIGTYNLAVLCAYHRIPFYIAAPSSTFDLSIASGDQIPIEERPGKELTTQFFKTPMAARGIKVFNPAFDVTPHALITAIITDRGIIRPPFAHNIRKALAL